MEDRPRPIHGRSPELWDALKAAGIVREDDHVRRVVIEIDADRAVTIYIEKYGDTRMFGILPVIGGRTEIVQVDRVPETVAEAEQI